MAYYLIKAWHPHRGQTEDKPGCLFYGGMIYKYPLSETNKARIDFCYTSKKRAERVAMKNSTIYTHCEVVEIPPELVERR